MYKVVPTELRQNSRADRYAYGSSVDGECVVVGESTPLVTPLTKPTARAPARCARHAASEPYSQPAPGRPGQASAPHGAALTRLVDTTVYDPDDDTPTPLAAPLAVRAHVHVPPRAHRPTGRTRESYSEQPRAPAGRDELMFLRRA